MCFFNKVFLWSNKISYPKHVIPLETKQGQSTSDLCTSSWFVHNNLFMIFKALTFTVNILQSLYTLFFYFYVSLLLENSVDLFLCSRSGHTTFYAEFVPHCSNSISKTNLSTNCPDKMHIWFLTIHKCTISFVTEMMHRSTKMKCIKILKHLQWRIMKIINTLMCTNHDEVHKSEVHARPCKRACLGHFIHKKSLWNGI